MGPCISGSWSSPACRRATDRTSGSGFQRMRTPYPAKARSPAPGRKWIVDPSRSSNRNHGASMAGIQVVAPAERLAIRISPLRGAPRCLRNFTNLRIVALRAGRERRIVPDLVVIGVTLQRSFTQDVVGIDQSGQRVVSRGRIGNVLPLARNPDVIGVGPAGGDSLVLAIEVFDGHRRPLHVREANQIDQAEAPFLLVPGGGISLLVEITEGAVMFKMVVSVALVEEVIAMVDDRWGNRAARYVGYRADVKVPRPVVDVRRVEHDELAPAAVGPDAPLVLLTRVRSKVAIDLPLFRQIRAESDEIGATLDRRRHISRARPPIAVSHRV